MLGNKQAHFSARLGRAQVDPISTLVLFITEMPSTLFGPQQNHRKKNLAIYTQALD